jgi:hypothetical protein
LQRLQSNASLLLSNRKQTAMSAAGSARSPVDPDHSIGSGSG